MYTENYTMWINVHVLGYKMQRKTGSSVFDNRYQCLSIISQEPVYVYTARLVVLGSCTRVLHWFQSMSKKNNWELLLIKLQIRSLMAHKNTANITCTGVYIYSPKAARPARVWAPCSVIGDYLKFLHLYTCVYRCSWTHWSSCSSVVVPSSVMETSKASLPTSQTSWLFTSD